MKCIISALLIASGLVFLGLSQRYDYHKNLATFRVDKLTGEISNCVRDKCEVFVEGTGIFKMLKGTGIFKTFNTWEK